MNKKLIPTVYALLAALLYAINTPFSKLLLAHVPETMMAAFLYLGAGLGVGIMYLFKFRQETPSDRLGKSDLPYTIGMIVLDIAAPIFLMLGIKHGTASNISLLGNFEIVATALIALLCFKERISPLLWTALGLITVSGALLTIEPSGSFAFSSGSLFALLATCCWGLENNCTRRIASKSSYQIVTLKGLCSGSGALLIALVKGETLPDFRFIALVLLLGFVSYGLSIFTYVRAQETLGAARTGAYYAVAPFVGMFLSFILLGDRLTKLFPIAFVLMAIGTVFAVRDSFSVDSSH